MDSNFMELNLLDRRELIKVVIERYVFLSCVKL